MTFLFPGSAGPGAEARSLAWNCRTANSYSVFGCSLWGTASGCGWAAWGPCSVSEEGEEEVMLQEQEATFI